MHCKLFPGHSQVVIMAGYCSFMFHVSWSNTSWVSMRFQDVIQYCLIHVPLLWKSESFFELVDMGYNFCRCNFCHYFTRKWGGRGVFWFLCRGGEGMGVPGRWAEDTPNPSKTSDHFKLFCCKALKLYVDPCLDGYPICCRNRLLLRLYRKVCDCVCNSR